MSILPADFAKQMEDLWNGQLGNVSSPAFRLLWERMGETFHQALLTGMKESPLTIGPKWFVLAPEMGVGKTMGALLYLAMLASGFRHLNYPLRFGGIFATRTITQCEEAVQRINELAGFSAAITRHSENKTTLAECRQYLFVSL